MAVSVDRQDGFQAVFGDEVVQRGVLAGIAVPGVDDGALFRVVPDDVGVFLYRVELQAGYFHNLRLFWCSLFRKDSVFAGFYLPL